MGCKSTTFSNTFFLFLLFFCILSKNAEKNAVLCEISGAKRTDIPVKGCVAEM